MRANSATSGVAVRLPRLLVLDLDGTLLRPDGSVGEEDAREVSRAHLDGMEVALATGRMRPSFEYVVNALGLEPYVIGVNGSYVSGPGRPPVVDATLPTATAVSMLKEIAGRGISAHIYTKEGNVITSADKYHSRTSAKVLHVPDIAEYVIQTGASVRKITCRGTTDEMIAVRDWMQSRWGDEAAISLTGPNSTEAWSMGCSKRRGLDLVLEMIQAEPQDVIAIGDADNDFELLSGVGYPVAMGNATPEIKRIACYVTSSNDECGVAQAIRHFREKGLLSSRREE